MGLRGKPPTPTEILKLRGARKDLINRDEPQPVKGRPKPPRTFTKEQRRAYRKLCEVLEAMNVLTTADGPQLERYVIFLLRWRDCEAFIAKTGTTYPIKSTDPVNYITGPLKDGTYIVGFGTYPQVRMSLTLDRALKTIELNFGLTPSARTRIVAMNASTGEGKKLDRFREALG